MRSQFTDEQYLKEMQIVKKAIDVCQNPSVNHQELMNLIPDMVQVRLLLSDINLVNEALFKLNHLLNTECESRLKSKQDNSKLLRKVIENELGKLGFIGALGKATDFLPREKFLYAISEGVLLKDPGAGINHGEFTHAIQWIIIGWINQKHHLLSQSAVDLFKSIGKIAKNQKTPALEFDFFIYSKAWNTIADEESDELLNKDIKFTCPDFLLKHILESNDDKLSILKNLCQSRVTKRASSTIFFSNSKKSFPKTIYKEDPNQHPELKMPNI